MDTNEFKITLYRDTQRKAAAIFVILLLGLAAASGWMRAAPSQCPATVASADTDATHLGRFVITPTSAQYVSHDAGQPQVATTRPTSSPS
jgi:hypothetical protein